MADKKSREVGELHVKVNVDVSEALTGLKAVQREAREAAKALRELEEAQKRSQALPWIPFRRAYTEGLRISNRYRKKPVEVIPAEVYRKGLEDGFSQTTESLGEGIRGVHIVTRPYIETLEGRMFISPGDYIITGIHGERYPCKPGIFEKTYEKI